MPNIIHKPIFNKRIFWDVNFDKMDYDAKANFVIERVFERGDVEDIRQCRRVLWRRKSGGCFIEC